MSMGAGCVYPSSSVFFNLLNFSSYKSSLAWLDLFQNICNYQCYCFLISFSMCLLLVYRWGINQNKLVLTLYLDTLLNVFISYRDFLVESSQACVCRITTSANEDALLVLCPSICFLFISFSCLTALAET